MLLAFLLALLSSAPAAPFGAIQSASPQALASASLVMAKDGDAVVHVTADAAHLPTATALDVVVDGEVRTTALLFGKIGHPSSVALVHGLTAGRHQVTLRPSPYWPWPAGAPAPGLTASPAAESEIVAHAPVLWLRADTIGVATDLPLMMYAEDLRTNGSGLVRYTIIFSNEDGGTATPALLARWGRTTDIEMAYEEDWRDGRVVASRYQGPDHHTPEYAGTREGAHPTLIVATLNNTFLDRGRTAVRVAFVPVVIDLRSATRESVMDGEPWIYRRMAAELQDEGKAGVSGDLREYLFVDARLTLSDAAVAAIARGTDGTWRSSDRGLKDLTVERAGWVRIAIQKSRGATEAGFVCTPTKSAQGTCRIEIGRVFSLNEDYSPAADRGAGALELQTGEMRTIPLRPR